MPWGVTQTFGSDKLGQLTNDNGTLYAYDKSGNRTGGGYVTGTGNRTTSDGTWAYTYDDAGQMTGKSKSGEAWAYTYDHAGRMTGASKSATPGGTVTDSVGYKLDAWGNRIERAQAGGTSSTQRYAVDGWDTAKPGAAGTEGFEAVMDLDGSNAVTARRVFGAGFDDAAARQDAGGGVTWYGADGLGSVRQVFDNSGNTTGSQAFTGFGVTAATSGTGQDRYAYSGTVTDPLTGLVGDDARQYDPALGKWTSDDPIGFAAGDHNVGRYGGNSPTNATDPSGLDWIRDLLGPSQSHDPVNPNRSRNDAWHAWITPFAPVKGAFRLAAMNSYNIQDALTANGYTEVGGLFRVAGDVNGWAEGLVDGVNPNPASKVAMVWGMAERWGAAYDTKHAKGWEPGMAAIHASSVLVWDQTGLTGFIEGFGGYDVVTEEELSKHERSSRGVVGAFQMATFFIPGPKGAKGCRTGGGKTPKVVVAAEKPFNPAELWRTPNRMEARMADVPAGGFPNGRKPLPMVDENAVIGKPPPADECPAPGAGKPVIPPPVVPKTDPPAPPAAPGTPAAIPGGATPRPSIDLGPIPGNRTQLNRPHPKWGHTWQQHGQQQKPDWHRNRAASAAGNKPDGTPKWTDPRTNPQQGYWLDNQKAAEHIRNQNLNVGYNEITIPNGMGQVVFPDGTTANPTVARVIVNADGTINTAYPVVFK